MFFCLYLFGLIFSFLKADEGNLRLYNGDNLGYLASSGVTHTFYFVMPKIVYVEYTKEVKNIGATIDFSDILSGGSSIKFTDLPVNGVLSTPLGITNSNNVYTLSSAPFVYKPDKTMTLERIHYIVTSSSTIDKKESMLILTIYQGFNCSLNEKLNTTSPICTKCKDNFYLIYNKNDICLSEDTKQNYFLKNGLYYPCDSKCTKCNTNENNCTVCAIGYYE